jgi:hypothetical protein
MSLWQREPHFLPAFKNPIKKPDLLKREATGCRREQVLVASCM